MIPLFPSTNMAIMVFSRKPIDPIYPICQIAHSAIAAVFLAALFAVTSVSVAAADEGDSDLEQAAEHFERGAELFFEERYGRALVEFRRAHRLNPHPMILYNKSIAYLRIGNPREARSRALGAEEMGGLGENEKIRNLARIDSLGVVLTAREVADNIASRPEVADTLDDVDPDEPPEPPEPPSRVGTMGWTGLGLSAIGAGLIGFAGLTHMRLSDTIESYEAAYNAGNLTQWEQLRGDIESGQRNGQIALYSGLGAALLGVSLFVIDRRGGTGASDESLRLIGTTAPSNAPGGMLNLFRRF